MSQSKSTLLAEVKKLMRRYGSSEYELVDHYEMLTLEKGKLSFLRYPDSVWTEKEIPMRELRECRDHLLDLID